VVHTTDYWFILGTVTPVPSEVIIMQIEANRNESRVKQLTYEHVVVSSMDQSSIIYERKK